MFSWAHTHTHFPQILYFTDIQDWRVLVSQVQLSASWCLFLILSFLVHIFFLSHFAVLTFNSWANLAVSLCLSRFRTSLLFCCFIFLFHFREHLHLIFFSCTFVVTSAAPTPALFVVCLVFLVTFFSYKFSSLKGFLLAFCRIQNGNTCYIQYLLLEFMPVLEKEEMMIILFNRNESMTPLLC